MYTTAEPTSPESLKSALSLGQMSLQPLVPFVGSRRGGNSRDILSSPSVNRNTENLCICLSPRLWWELGYTPEMLRSKQCVRNSINLTAAGKKSSVHLQIEILGLVICPQAGEGHREGWGALGLPKGTNPHWLLYRDFPVFKSLITENWSTKIYLQGLFSKKKQFLPAFLSVTLSQQLRGWNQGISGGFHSGPRASTHQSSSFVNCSYGG